MANTEAPGSPRLLRLIAGERAARGLVLLIGGVYLLTHLGSDLGRLADHLMRAVELDPKRPFLHHLIVRLHALRVGTLVVTGIAAIAYGILELVEGGGLWLDRLWAEYLTVVATSLLIPFELYEVVHRASLLKAAGLLVNAAIVLYLARRLHRRISERSEEAASIAAEE